jgi:hypothetical protein
VNSKEENSQDFCSNYVQEFGLSTMPHSLRETLSSGQATFIRAWNYSTVQYSSSVCDKLWLTKMSHGTNILNPTGVCFKRKKIL